MSENITSQQPLKHIAFIMDGNGRWAKKRGLPRDHGHRFGVTAFETVLKHCEKLGIQTVTVYAFSTENWKRPPKEVETIMKLMDHYLAECEKKIDEYNMHICFLGDKSPFEEKRRARMERLEKLTANKPRVLNIALNYGGRHELVRATQNIGKLIKQGKLDPADIDEELISSHLDTAGCPDCDLDRKSVV